MKRILIVDDEVQILKALSRMFLETDCEIYTAENGMDALKIIETTELDMIISDMRMPVLDGYKLLSIVKEKYPKIIRIILSGYADEKSMYKAILHNVARFYIFKPWDNTLFLQKIEKLFADDNVLNSVELMNTIKDMGCTSSIPDNCQKMIKLIEEEDIDSVIAEIEKDADISELLIQVSKSAVYGVMPNTVKQAAIYIGLPNLKSFMHWACVVSVTKLTNDIEHKPELLWTHAYLTNRIFLFFYEAFLHKQPPESTMFAGLLHNIGLIILMRSLQKKGSIDQSKLTIDDFVQLENGDYSLKHQEIGAHFLDLWDLSFPMYEVALYHHRPVENSVIFDELVSAVHIAQIYAWKTLGATNTDPVDETIFEKLGFSSNEFERRLSKYLKQ